jgi:hypothetical protein
VNRNSFCENRRGERRRRLHRATAYIPSESLKKFVGSQFNIFDDDSLAPRHGRSPHRSMAAIDFAIAIQESLFETTVSSDT